MIRQPKQQEHRSRTHYQHQQIRKRPAVFIRKVGRPKQRLRPARQLPEHPHLLRRCSTSLVASGIEFRTKPGAIWTDDVADLPITDHQAVFSAFFTMVGWSSSTIVAVGACSACHLRMTPSACG